MKILELHYSTSWAGAERVVVDLSNELAKTNEVILCTIEDDSNPTKSYYKKELSSNIKYINLKCNSGLQLKALWRIYKTIKSVKPDIVHAHTDLICLFIPALLYTNTSYFHTLHNLAEICLYKKCLKPLYKFFYKYKVTPITISTICNESFQQLYNIYPVQIDNGRTPPTTTKRLHEVKQEICSLKYHEDDKVFIHIARCEVQKNQELLIDSFNRFIKDGLHGILIMIGAGYDSPQNKHLLQKAQKGIYWIGVKNNICDYLSQSDFFILSSKYEGLPISLLEALSCGVIPICTPAGGIPDVISNKDYGYVSSGFDCENFYHTIVEAFTQYDKFNKKRLIQYFNERFSMNICAKKYIKAFTKSI